MDIKTWVMIGAVILAGITLIFVYPQSSQDTKILQQYTQELNDNVKVIDIVVYTTTETEKEVREYIKKKYPNFEIVSITKKEKKYFIRLEEVKNK